MAPVCDTLHVFIMVCISFYGEREHFTICRSVGRLPPRRSVAAVSVIEV
jgi:hypothetical protein